MVKGTQGGGETYSPHALENIQHNAIVLVDVFILIPVGARYGGIVAECGIPVYSLATTLCILNSTFLSAQSVQSPKSRLHHQAVHQTETIPENEV